ncbi:MFS transporter [Pseudomonas fontis]|uniref:MFS transporter n=1 Tax=Pseudomonas fontis TaxID=2942633 RepID=A0ABT5NZB5_9PSED|nr:MFS transporter [Pseudomonas fontis]MDD0976776.1 MFS transporter [Pseudomonas fontis]MDD0993541.1 MFS transporter [Pseudomonas fontis]
MQAPSSASRVALFLCGCAAFLPLYATQGILGELARQFAVSIRQVSWTLTLTTLAVAVTAPFVGWLGQRWRPPAVIVAAVLLLATPVLLVATVDSFDELLLWRLVQGLLIPVIFATSVGLIGERWQGANVTEVTSLYVAGTILGGFAGRFVTALITDYWGWREAFMVLAGLVLLIGLGIHLLLAPGPAPQVFKRKAKGRFGWPLWAACAVGFCVLFSQVASFTYAGLYLSEAPFSLGTAALGSIYAVFLLALVVTPIAGRLAKARPPLHLLLVAGVIGMLGSGLMLVPVLWVIVLGLALSSTGVFLAQAAANAFIARTAGENKAGAIGRYLTCYYLGGSAGALLPALVWVQWGWVGCVLMVIGFQVAFMLIGRLGWRA